MYPLRKISIVLLPALLLALSLAIPPLLWAANKTIALNVDTTFENVEYTSHTALEKIFQHEAEWIPERQKLKIADTQGGFWYFTLDNPYIVIGEVPYNLSYPVRRGIEKLYIPTRPLAKLLSQKLHLSITLDTLPTKKIALAPKHALPASDSVSNGSKNVSDNIISINIDARENGDLIAIKTRSKMEIESFWIAPHFIFKIQNGQLSANINRKITGNGLVKSVTALQEKDVTQFTFNIPKNIDTVEAEYSEELPGYVITVRKQSKKGPSAESKVMEEQGTNKNIKTVIIDPGHGGKDPGAQVAGVNEADITLAIGLELQKQLQKAGFNALMTRDDNTFVTLPGRPKFASEKGGDLFISLHCNAIGGSSKHKQSISGFTAYILRAGESEEDKALARRENAAIAEENGKNNKAEIAPVQWILLEHQLNLYSKESERFVENIVHEFEGAAIPRYLSGASQAGFYVLVGAYMPAILFEMGFLTNDEDRRHLNSAKGQKEIAQKLTSSVQKYAKSLGG